jgi:hypothetical protein
MTRGNLWRWGVLEMPGLVENVDHSLVFFVGRNAGVFQRPHDVQGVPLQRFFVLVHRLPQFAHVVMLVRLQEFRIPYFIGQFWLVNGKKLRMGTIGLSLCESLPGCSK